MVRKVPAAKLPDASTAIRQARRATARFDSTGLSADEHRLTGVETVAAGGEAISRSVARSGGAEIAFIPAGPYVVPFHSSTPS